MIKYKKIKIGVILNNYNNLKNYQINLLDSLRRFEAVSFVFFQINSENLKIKKYFFLEKEIFRNNTPNILNKFKKKYKSNFINKLKISDLEYINYKNLDLFINLSEQLLIKKIKKTNVNFWDVIYGSDEKQTELLCFDDVVNNNKYSQVKILEFNKNEKIYKIGEGFFNIRSFALLHEEFLKEKSVVIILKCFRLFLENRQKKIFYKLNLVLRKINFLDIFKYYYNCFFLNFFKKFLYKKKWNIFFGKTNRNNLISNSFLNKKNFLIKSNSQGYYADPFIVNSANKRFVFFENFLYKYNRGSISVASIDNKNNVSIKNIINKKYHLSYPFIYKNKNQFYLLPESSKKKELQIWICKEFPYKWALLKTLFKGESVADPTLYEDKKKQLWLFVNKSIDKFNNHDSELYIYKIEGLFDNLIEHKNNPVIINSEIGRNAGNIFTNGDSVFKPCQVNTYGIYGNGLYLIKILKLSLSEFIYKKKKFIPDIHHLSCDNDYYSYDNFF